MDKVFITDLRVDTIIGIFEWEREVRQTVSLDIEMAHDISQAAATDDIQFALNYKAVAKRLIQFIETSEFLLVETLAENCAELIQREFGVRWVALKVRKPGALRNARDVGVEIRRGTLD